MLKNEYFLADAVQIMVDRGAKVITAPVTVWEDCGNVRNLLSTNRYLLNRDRPSPPRLASATVIAAVVRRSDRDRRARPSIGPYASIGAMP